MLRNYSSLQEIKKDIEDGKISCKELVEYYLKNIEDNKHLNAFLEVYSEEALQQADEVDVKIKNGTAGELAGMVIGLKDVLCHKDHGLQSASKILDGFKSQFTSSAVQNLLDQDAIVIGRQNCDEFAMGSSNENSAFGPVLNATDTSKVPGGSSGGSAVAVQADMCQVSLGTDTGGSVRQPASFCGIVGLKPTYSRISRYGLAAYASSFDTIGVLAKSIEDTALVLEYLAGPDEFDSTVSQKSVPSYSKELSLNKSLKIGYLKESLGGEGLQKEISERTEKTIRSLEDQGHTCESFEISLLDHILPSYYILTAAEASTNLSRYDGVRFGHRSEEATDIVSMYKKSRTEGFGEEVKKRIMLGTFVLSHGYYDAYYSKAQKIRRLIKEETDKLFEKYDFLILPTAPTTAFKLGDHQDSLSMYLADLFTVQASLCGIPAISVPNGVDGEGMPVGLQVMAKAFDESQLLAFSKYLMGDIN